MQCSTRNEVDKFHKFIYCANTKQGARSLVKSFECKYPIRVFRSSKCSKYAPPAGKKGSSKYRYDGLYKITKSSEVENTLEKYFMFHLRKVSALDLSRFSFLDLYHQQENIDSCMFAALHLMFLRMKDIPKVDASSCLVKLPKK